MKTALALLLVVFICGCGGCQTPAPGFIYGKACDAVRAAPGVPPDASFLPIEQARVGLAKNAASVDVPYECRDASGQKVTRWQTVWFKRVARTWTVTKVEPTPVYPPVPAATGAEPAR